MNQNIDGMNKVMLGLGVADGLWLSAAALTLTATVGAARVGMTPAQAAARPNKAENGMNLPGVEVEVQAPITVVVPHNAIRLVWLKTDKTLALSEKPAAGQSYNDVAPEMQPDIHSGAMIEGTRISQKGPLRETEPASVLLGEVTTSADSATVTFAGVWAAGDTATITVDGVAVVATLIAGEDTVAEAAERAKLAIEADAVTAAKVTVTRAGAVLTIASKTATAYTLAAAEATVGTGTAVASGNLSGSAIASFSNLLRTKVLLGNGTK